MDRKQTPNTVKDQSLSEHWSASPLAVGNAAYLEPLYEQFLEDPAAVPPAWRRYFEGLPRVDGVTQDISHSAIREEFRRLAHQRQAPVAPRVQPSPDSNYSAWTTASARRGDGSASGSARNRF